MHNLILRSFICPILLTAATIVTGCSSMHEPKIKMAKPGGLINDPFPSAKVLPVGQDEILPANISRIREYHDYHENSTPGDKVGVVEFVRAIPGFGSQTFQAIELNFNVQRPGAAGVCFPPKAYEQESVNHFFYLKESWMALMTALNGNRPMYVRWDRENGIADISSDKKFQTPQPWVPLQIDWHYSVATRRGSSQ